MIDVKEKGNNERSDAFASMSQNTGSCLWNQSKHGAYVSSWNPSDSRGAEHD